MDKDKIVGTVRAALEYEPRVNLHRHPISIGYAGGAVVLEGYVRTEEERRQAERDAWALFAVDNVVNNIEVRG